jgi:hypothetical protein
MSELTDQVFAATDDIDPRLRAALEPTAEGARRVADLALARATRRQWRRPTALLGVAAVLALLTTAGVVRWRNPPVAVVGAGVAAARISSVGRLVIAESGEGETWIRASSARRSEPRPGTRITIVLKESP